MVDDELARLQADLRRFIARRVPPDRVDDVVQDVLLRLVTHRERIEGSVRGWTHRVARNAIADVHRARPPSPLTEEPEAPREDEGTDVRPLARWLRGAVDDLPEPYRETLRLSELDGLGHAEVAARQGVSISAVKSRVVRGRAKLRAALLRCCEVELDVRGRIIEYAPRVCCGR